MMTSPTIMMPNEVLRETYENGPYYNDKDTGDMSPYNKESLFTEENARGRMEGQVQ